MKYFLASLLILILSFLNVLRPIQNIFTFLLNPMQKTFRQIGTELNDYTKFVGNIFSLYEENQSLKEQVLTLQSSLVDSHGLREENLALKEQFLLTETSLEDSSTDIPESPEQLIMANIIGNSSDPTKSTVYIDKGSKHGILVGNPLIYKNNLVGKVLEVYSRRSLVAFLFCPQTNVAVKNISSGTSTEGIVTGEFGTGIKLDRVLQKESLQMGDVFVTSGREGIFQPNLIVGKVTEIYDIPTEPLKSARITPLIELDRLVKIFVFIEGSKE